MFWRLTCLFFSSVQAHLCSPSVLSHSRQARRAFVNNCTREVQKYRAFLSCLTFVHSSMSSTLGSSTANVAPQWRLPLQTLTKGAVEMPFVNRTSVVAEFDRFVGFNATLSAGDVAELASKNGCFWNFIYHFLCFGNKQLKLGWVPSWVFRVDMNKRFIVYHWEFEEETVASSGCNLDYSTFFPLPTLPGNYGCRCSQIWIPRPPVSANYRQDPLSMVIFVRLKKNYRKTLKHGFGFSLVQLFWNKPTDTTQDKVKLGSYNTLAATTTIKVLLSVRVRLLCALNMTHSLVYLLGYQLARAELQGYFSLWSTIRSFQIKSDL